MHRISGTHSTAEIKDIRLMFELYSAPMRWPFALKHDAQDQHPTGGAGTNTGAKVSVRQFGTGAKVSWC